MRELDEGHKSVGNETGSFPFSKGSDAATFARASKEKSMTHSPLDGRSLQSRSFEKKAEINMSNFDEAENDEIIMIGSARQKHEEEDRELEPQFIHQSNVYILTIRTRAVKRRIS